MTTTTRTNTTRKLDWEVCVIITQFQTLTLGRFLYESGALMFARAYFADGTNGGDVIVWNDFLGELSAASEGDKWDDYSEGARTQGYNG